jgi:hypothetical protein
MQEYYIPEALKKEIAKCELAEAKLRRNTNEMG